MPLFVYLIVCTNSLDVITGIPNSTASIRSQVLTIKGSPFRKHSRPRMCVLLVLRLSFASVVPCAYTPFRQASRGTQPSRALHI